MLRLLISSLWMNEAFALVPKLELNATCQQQ